jgi:hypothetical protein
MFQKGRLGYGATEGESIEKVFPFLDSNGLKTVEINLNVPTFLPEYYNLEEVKNLSRIIDRKGYNVTFHGPEDITLLTPHKELMDGGLKRTDILMTYGKSLGGKRFTLHTGNSVYFTEIEGKRYMHKTYPTEYKGHLRYALEELIKISIKNDITLCIENEGSFDTEVIQPVLQEYLNSSDIKLTWDVGHSAYVEYMRAFMENNLEHVANVHLHDHDGIKDHMILGTGYLDFSYYADLFKNLDVYYILEIRPKEGIIPSIEFLNSKGLIKNTGRGE